MSTQRNRYNEKGLISSALSGKGQEKWIIACPVFRKELEAILAEIELTPHILYMDYTVHINPESMDKELQSSIEKVSSAGQGPRFLVGRECRGIREMTEVVERCGGKIPQCRNCIDMLIGKELVEKLQGERTSLMTPAWIRMIRQSIDDGQWSVTDARLNLGWYDKIVLLDTGVEPLDDEQIMEFYDLIQVEVEIVAVDLSHFKTLLQNLLQ